MNYLYKIHIHIQIRPYTLLQKADETQQQKKKVFSYIIYLRQHTIRNMNSFFLSIHRLLPGTNNAKMTVTASATATGK